MNEPRARAFHDTAQNQEILGGGALQTIEGLYVNNYFSG